MIFFNTTEKKEEFLWMNGKLMAEFENMQYVKYGIYILFLLIVILLFMQTFNVRTLTKNKGARRSVELIKQQRLRDASIIGLNRFLRTITDIVQSSAFRMPAHNSEFLQYNLNRANVKIPGGKRYMTAEEFSSIRVMVVAAAVLISIVVGLISSPVIGVLMGGTSMFMGSSMPMILLRAKVREKDDEINKEFPDFYLMLHGVLMGGAKTPIDKVMKSYAKTTESEELKRFIDIAGGHIEAYTEYNAMEHIARDYREVPYIGKLCRLIKQLYSRAEVEEELIGFRNELMIDKKYRMDKSMQKLISKVQASFNVLMIILVQAIMSSMAIYLPQLTGAGSWV